MNRILYMGVLAGALVGVGGARAATVSGTVQVGDRPGWRVAVILDDGSAVHARPIEAHLDEQWMSFIPKVQVVAPGSTLLLGNQDDSAHTVHGWRGSETIFSFATVPSGPAQRVVLREPGVVRISCDMHEAMSAVVVVTSSSLFAITDEQGRFSIADVPAGRYAVRAVLPTRKRSSQDRTSEPGAFVQTIDVGAAPIALQFSLVAPQEATATQSVAPPKEAHVRTPSWLSRMSGVRSTWPTGVWIYIAAFVALLIGLGGSRAIFLRAERQGSSVARPILQSCVLALVGGLLFAVGLDAAVATALGFGLFLGASIFGAAMK